jgi:NADH:ubiquinone reductase (H+-translocating)
MTHRIVVLGAGYAGLPAAKRMARRLRREGVTVTLVNAVDVFVERVRLHQLAAGQQLPSLSLSELLDGTGVDLVVAKVTGIDVYRRQVHLDRRSVGYDTLVYALGSAADVDAVPGVAESCFTVASAAEAMRLCRQVAELETLTVVGGGLTGIEAAAELAECHPRLRVQLVTSGSFGGWLSRRAQRHLRATFDRLGIHVHEHTSVAEVRGGKVLSTENAAISADAVLWAGGFQVSPMAALAGLAVDSRGRIVVDATLRSVSHPQVYGVGDAAVAPTIAGRRTRMSCQSGLPMGAYVGAAISRRLTGTDMRPSRLRYVWTNISLGRRDAITQFTHADDTPRGSVLTGRPAAAFKELVTRSTVVAMRAVG